MFIYNIPKMERIIDNYKKQARKPVDYHIEFCLQQENLKDAIEVAAKAIDEYGKIHYHQRRIGKAELLSFAEQLITHETALANAVNFDEIFNIVRNINQAGINEVTCFDTALRIGSYRNIFPDKIYLTSGIRIGAEHLLGKLGDVTFLLPSDLPCPFQRKDLSIADIEDLLYLNRNDWQYCVK